jgi:hypothetical protein
VLAGEGEIFEQRGSFPARGYCWKERVTVYIMNFEGSQPVYLRKDLEKGVKEGFVSAFAIPVGEMQAKKRGA